MVCFDAISVGVLQACRLYKQKLWHLGRQSAQVGEGLRDLDREKRRRTGELNDDTQDQPAEQYRDVLPML